MVLRKGKELHKRKGHIRNKRTYQRIMDSEVEHVSKKSDNRVVCLKTGRPKFLYQTLKKAKLACAYATEPQRPYYCKACKGYHTTSETKDEYYERLEDVMPYEIKRTDNDHGFIDKDHKRVRRED